MDGERDPGLLRRTRSSQSMSISMVKADGTPSPGLQVVDNCKESLPGRTDNEIKNYWRTHYKNKGKPTKNIEKQRAKFLRHQQQQKLQNKQLNPLVKENNNAEETLTTTCINDSTKMDKEHGGGGSTTINGDDDLRLSGARRMCIVHKKIYCKLVRSLNPSSRTSDLKAVLHPLKPCSSHSQIWFPSPMEGSSERRSSGIRLLQDLQSLSQSIARPTASSRGASLSLQTFGDGDAAATDTHRRSNSGRFSLSSWLPRAKECQPAGSNSLINLKPLISASPDSAKKKKGVKDWKPIRLLTHIRMRRISCLFSVEVIAIRSVPESMNGLRLSVGIRKRESRDGAVCTMPTRVLHGSADFDETLFIQCHVYFTGGGAPAKTIKLEPRPFFVSAIAVDAPEINLGRSSVDLSQLISEFMEQSSEEARLRRWSADIELAGKAKGGMLILGLGFQIMDDGGVGLYEISKGLTDQSAAMARRHSKNSFSVSCPRALSTLDYRVKNRPIIGQPEAEYEVIDKGIEIKIAGEDDGEPGEASVSSDVIEEEKFFRLMELDSIAKDIKELEEIMVMNDDMLITESEKKQLDDGEETVTMEYLQKLDAEANKKLQGVEQKGDMEEKVLLSDLGNGLGPVIQTKDGGFLASMNPLNTKVARKEIPKLAMQISRPFVLRDQKLASGLEVFQRFAAVGLEDLCSRLEKMTDMDDLIGKTAEQIAFEGIASAIISGRSREWASSTAAKSNASVRRMISAMSQERKERVWREIWYVEEEPVVLEEILPFSMKRMEEMALYALNIQAGMAEEEAPFDVSPISGGDDPWQILDSAVSFDEWKRVSEAEVRLTLLVLIQMRDPIRRYEAVGAPLIALTQAIRRNDIDREEDDDIKYNVLSVHVGGMKGERRKSTWDGEKQKLSTAAKWLAANGMGNQGKKTRASKAKLQQEVLWSVSSRIMADVWLMPKRNPDVKPHRPPALPACHGHRWRAGPCESIAIARLRATCQEKRSAKKRDVPTPAESAALVCGHQHSDDGHQHHRRQSRMTGKWVGSGERVEDGNIILFCGDFKI
ncbi:hypothetical protein AXF42_Ash003686 [Apostasia shenzhenica]|uniref:C2 NT-type domain-containing protein n=1 Tax=Apostasia shenzhenica TaxID=1088818 RepID=A0A2I0AHL0_9ASPA|nr:hypothetical protein AXF42_Ash003686 [Apostasia shenzhenica]